MESASQTVDALFEWVVLNSARASVLVAAVLALQLLTRRKLPPRWQYALWFLVIARLMMPAGLPSAWSVYNWVPEFATFAVDKMDGTEATEYLPLELDQSVLADASAARHGAAPATAIETLPQSIKSSPAEMNGSAADSVYIPTKVPAPAAQAWQAAYLLPFLPWLWLAGAAIFAIIILAANWRLLRAVRRQRLITSTDLLTEFERCKREMNIVTPVALVATNLRGGPALFGCIRPRLLIPEALLGTLSTRELRHVLYHELAHLKRRDILVNWLVAALQIVHWFNPVLWYAFYRMRADREVACDALALSYLEPDEAQAYGRTILAMFDTHRRVRALPGVAGILEDKTHLKRRIAMIAAFTKPSRRWTVVALCLFVALGVAGLTEAREDEAEQPDKSASASSEANILATPSVVNESLHETQVPEPLAVFESTHPAAAAQAPAALHETEHRVLATTGTAVEEPAVVVEEPAVVVEAPAVVLEAPAVDGETVYRIMPVPEDPDAAGVPGAVPMPPTPPRGGIGFVRPNPTVRRAPRQEPPDEELLKSLEAPVSIEFEDEHIQTIAEFISDYVELNIVIDSRVVAPKDEEYREVAPQDLYEGGYVTNGLVGHINLQDVVLRSALEALLRPLHLDYALRPGFVWVSSPQLLEQEGLPAEIGTLPWNGPQWRPEAQPARPVRLPVVPLPPLEQQEGRRERSLNNGEDVEYLQYDVNGDGIPETVPFRELRANRRDEGVDPAMNLEAVPDQVPLAQPRDESNGSDDDGADESGHAVLNGEDVEGAEMAESDAMERILEAPISLEFEKTHIQEIAAFISDYCELNIVIDNRVVAPAGAGIAPGAQFVTDGLVPYIRLEDVPLRQALDALLRPLNLTFTVQQGFIWITTEENAKAENFGA